MDQSSSAMASPRGPMPVLPHEARVRHARHVDIVGREIEKERAGAILFQKRNGLAGDRVRHILIHPARGLAAGHIADPADAVDDGHVVAVAGVHLEEIGIGRAGGFAGERVVVIHADRVFRVQVDDAAVLHEDARHAVAGGRENEGVVETDVERTGRDLAIPIEVAGAQAEMPLADHAGAVAGLFQHGGERVAAGLDDQRRVARAGRRCPDGARRTRRSAANSATACRWRKRSARW